MKKKLMNIVFLFTIIIVLTTGCGLMKGNSGKNNIAKNAEILNWNEVHDIISSNGAKAEDYNGKWYIFTARVTNIEKDSCKMYLDTSSDGYPVNPISVYLPTAELKKLVNGQALTVVGKLDAAKAFSSLKDAFVFPEELYSDDSFKIEMISHKDRNYAGHYFKDYEFNEMDLPIKYTEISYSNRVHGKYQYNYLDTDEYTLEYNEKGQLITKTIQKYKYDGKENKTAGKDVITYTYNENGFIEKEVKNNNEYIYKYEKDKDGNIIKGTKNKGNKVDLTLEYNKKGQIVKEIGMFTTAELKYDSNGHLIEKKSVYNDSQKINEDIIYSYGVVGKK